MAEEAEKNNQIYILDNDKLKKQIDDLFFKWFDRDYKILAHKDESFSANESLDTLTNIVKRIRAMASDEANKANKPLVDLGVALEDFILRGNAESALDILRGRSREDHISKVMWLINVTTTVGVLGRELKEGETSAKPLDKGPLKKLNVSAKNVEQFVIPVQTSTEMKTPSKFIGNVLPSKFAAVAKHSSLAKSASRRAAFSGMEYHNAATMDSIYHDLGEALVFISTDFFAEANNALTDNGRRNAAGKVKDYDFKNLSEKEHAKLMETMHAAFRKYANYTIELSMLSNINDKLVIDSAMCAFYDYMDDNVKDRSGFNEEQLRSLPNALDFAKKFPNEYNTAYNRYLNHFMTGLSDAIKHEQDAVKKEWFENKINGERVFRRGRLAGHGNKFMHTAPMEWLDNKLKEKHGLIWLLPKLGMTTLKILTNPALHKLRKKLTGTLFAALRSFATGVKENMDKAGRSTEVTYEDVIKAIKAGEEELKKIHNEKIVTTNESVQLTESEDSDADDDAVSFDEPRSRIEYDEKNGPLYDLADKIETVAEYSKKAASDEAVKEDIKKFENANSQLKQEFLTDEFIQILNTLANTDTENADDSDILKALRDKFSGSNFVSELDSAGINILLSQVLPAYEDYTEAISNYKMKKDEREEMDSSNAKHAKDSDSTINVGEQSVKICEEVYEVLNKYIARQWNLLALHSEHKTMPLCAKYITIDLDKPISDSTSPKAQAKTESVLSRSLSDWLNEVIEYDTSADEQSEEVDGEYWHQDKTLDEAKDLDTTLGADRRARDSRNRANKENGKTTADYPIKYNGKYRYHGIELVASSTDETKNGFGVFTERLIKIAKPVVEFRDFVETLRNESQNKTFNNDMKDFKDFKGSKSKKGSKSRIVNPLEATFVSAEELLSEDIVNKAIKHADAATDKIGDWAKTGINKLGQYTGTGLGKLVHGITHTGTKEKDKEMAKTIDDLGTYKVDLLYSYSRKLKLSYLNEGAKIVASNILTESARKEFNNITKLAEALYTANFANSRSINAIASALSSFKSAMSGVNFKPCKAVINYKLANLMNEGKLNATTDLRFGVIKGLYISNWEDVREYSREMTTDELKDAVAKGDVEREKLAPEEQNKLKKDEKEQKEKQSKADAIAKAHQQVADNNKRREDNAESARKAQESGEAERRKKEQDEETLEHLADSTNVKLDGLSTLFEQINNTIDWKEYLNG